MGAAFAANQKPDGYKLLVALTSMLVIPEAEKVAGKQPSYEVNQFIPIAEEQYDFIIPKSRIHFVKNGEQTKSSWFDTIWVCYNMGLENDITFL